MDKITVVGAGNIGLRHIQALLLSEKPLELHVMDPSDESLQRVKQVWEQAELKTEIKINFAKNIDELPKQIELAIVATASNIRRQVVEQMIIGHGIRNLILEKVLFQKVEDYDAVYALLCKNNIPTWVNCPRRMYPIYESIKEELSDVENMQILVSGGQAWELACNAIHMVDLIGYLAGCENGKVDLSGLDKEMYESKRKGFLEVGGTIKGCLGRCDSFAITTDKKNILPLTVMIDSPKMKCIINENTKKIAIARSCNNWEYEKIEGIFPYQSQLTHMAVWSILEQGMCQLPTFQEAKYEHLLLQIPLTEYFEKQGVEKGLCPIT